MVVRILETKNKIYQFGYNSIMKTSYEEQQEQRRRFYLVTFQRLIAIVLMITMTKLSAFCGDGTAAIISYIIGIPTLLSKKFIFS